MHSAEADLLTRAVAGERPALEQLLHAHHRQLLSYVERHLPLDLARVVQAQDVLQETYFDAFRRIGTFRPEGESSFYRWLVTIAR